MTPDDLDLDRLDALAADVMTADAPNPEAFISRACTLATAVPALTAALRDARAEVARLREINHGLVEDFNGLSEHTARLREQVERVRALVDEWHAEDSVAQVYAGLIRAALDGGAS